MDKDNYLEQQENVFVPVSNWHIVASLLVALILNFLPLQGTLLILRPDFVAMAIIYWSINSPYKLGMGVAFGMGLLMDAGDHGILGQHALAYCVIVYLALIFGRRLRLFALMRQAPQIGLILLVLQGVMILIAVLGGLPSPGWQYFLAALTGALFWIPVCYLLNRLLRQQPDPDTL